MKEVGKSAPGTLVITESNRKVRSLYRWLSRVTGLEACWIEGKDKHDHPLWGFVKRIAKNKLVVFSRKVAVASLVLSPLFFSPNLSAQTAIELSDLNGIDGAAFNGITSKDDAGTSIAIGDINGDNIADLIINAPNGDNGGSNAGETYVVFGTSSGFNSSVNLGSLNGTTGFVLNGIDANDVSGSGLAIGDINGDNIGDIIIGADAETTGNSASGEAYVIFGKTTAFASSLDISDLIDGTSGFLLNGVDASDRAGTAVAVGDINNDDVEDVIIGAKSADPNGSNSGETYVVFGKTTAFGATVELSGLDGSTGFKLNGVSGGDNSGEALAVGDINNDNFDDVIIGAPNGDNGGSNSGETYVVFGQASFSGSSVIELSDLNGTTGFVLNGQGGSDESGSAVASGDINGDGIEDVIIGAPKEHSPSNDEGETYVYFGKTTAFDSAIELSDLDGSIGFVLSGISTGDQSGGAVAAGDVNGDGIGDVIIGARYGDPNNDGAGETYVLFGKTTSFDSSINLSSLNGSTGFALNGDSYYGYSGSSLASGDINGDGFDDIVVGAPGVNSERGRTYAFFNNVPQTITGDDGFRTLAAPSNGTVFDELLGDFFTQGFTGSDGPSGSDNAWTWDDGTQAWTALTNQTTNSLSAGNGFLFYLFSDDNGSGTSGDAGFPKQISANQFGGDGTRNSGSVNPVSSLADTDFFLAGNPYFFPIDWDLLTKSGLSNTIYVYDDANSTWQTWNGTLGNLTDGEIAAFQGFFIQGSGGSGSLTIQENDIISNSVSLLKQNDTEPKALKIHAEAGELSADAWLSFQEGGEVGRDAFDGLALTPLASSYLRLATIIDNDDELQINALPIDHDEELRFPLDLSGISDSSQAEISFEGLDKFEDWTITIEDLDTDDVFELNQNDTISLAIRSAQAKTVGLPSSLVNPKAKATEHQFEIVLKPKLGVHTENPRSNLPEHITLEQNYPNPFNPNTRILFEVPRAGLVTLEVFNLVGQKVAELVNERKAAGSYEVNFDASSLSSGIYVYRLTAGAQTLTRKMTLIK